MLNNNISRTIRTRFALTLIILLALMAFLSGCGSGAENNTTNNKEEVYISAASSLNKVMNELEEVYEAVHPGINLIINFGGSGTLQKQIEQGAPMDLFISAGAQQMNALDEKRFIAENSRTDLLTNELVLIAPSNSSEIEGVKDLRNSNIKIALANPDSVPAGRYAKQALISYGLWEEIQANIILAKDVTQVRSYVETGNVEVGFVYATDVISTPKVKVITVIQADKHEPIVYPAAVIKNGNNETGARDFLTFLQGLEGKAIFNKYGFR